MKIASIYYRRRDLRCTRLYLSQEVSAIRAAYFFVAAHWQTCGTAVNLTVKLQRLCDAKAFSQTFRKAETEPSHPASKQLFRLLSSARLVFLMAKTSYSEESQPTGSNSTELCSEPALSHPIVATDRPVVLRLFELSFLPSSPHSSPHSFSHLSPHGRTYAPPARPFHISLKIPLGTVFVSRHTGIAKRLFVFAPPLFVQAKKPIFCGFSHARP